MKEKDERKGLPSVTQEKRIDFFLLKVLVTSFCIKSRILKEPKLRHFVSQIDYDPG